MPSISTRDEIVIHATSDLIFSIVSDYENISSWLPVYSCKYLNGTKVTEGLKVYHQYGRPPFVMSKFTRVINKVIPGYRLEETYIDGDLKGTGVWSFEKSDHGTITAYECNVTSQRLLPHIAFSLFGKNAHSIVYKPLLKKLKSHCEAL